VSCATAHAATVERIEPAFSVKTKTLRNGKEEEVILVLNSGSKVPFPKITPRRWRSKIKLFSSSYKYEQLPKSFTIGYIMELQNYTVEKALAKLIDAILRMRVGFNPVAESELMLQLFLLFASRVEVASLPQDQLAEALEQVKRVTKLNYDVEEGINLDDIIQQLQEQFIAKYSVSGRLSALCSVDSYIAKRNKEAAMSSHWNNLHKGRPYFALYSINTALTDSKRYLDEAILYDEYNEYSAFIKKEQHALEIYDFYHTFFLLRTYAYEDWEFAKAAVSRYMARNRGSTLVVTAVDGTILEIYDVFNINLDPQGKIL